MCVGYDVCDDCMGGVWDGLILGFGLEFRSVWVGTWSSRGSDGFGFPWARNELSWFDHEVFGCVVCEHVD